LDKDDYKDFLVRFSRWINNLGLTVG